MGHSAMMRCGNGRETTCHCRERERETPEQRQGPAPAQHCRSPPLPLHLSVYLIFLLFLLISSALSLFLSLCLSETVSHVSVLSVSHRLPNFSRLWPTSETMSRAGQGNTVVVLSNSLFISILQHKIKVKPLATMKTNVLLIILILLHVKSAEKSYKSS